MKKEQSQYTQITIPVDVWQKYQPEVGKFQSRWGKFIENFGMYLKRATVVEQQNKKKHYEQVEESAQRNKPQ